MNKLTYKEAYDKIIQAYFNDEIKPFDGEFCFCGTLNNGNHRWTTQKVCSTGYKGHELYNMETALYKSLQRCGLVIREKYGNTNVNLVEYWEVVNKHPVYEDALFEGMSCALEVLRQIHIERGENVDDDIPVFTKRKLEKVI